MPLGALDPRGRTTRCPPPGGFGDVLGSHVAHEIDFAAPLEGVRPRAALAALGSSGRSFGGGPVLELGGGPVVKLAGGPVLELAGGPVLELAGGPVIELAGERL